MVFDPPKKSVDITRMIIYSFIPVLSIYAGWRIQKFWVLLGIGLVVDFGLGTLIGTFLPGVYGSVTALVISIPVSVFIVRHYARKYNEKVAASEAHASSL